MFGRDRSTLADGTLTSKHYEVYSCSSIRGIACVSETVVIGSIDKTLLLIRVRVALVSIFPPGAVLYRGNNQRHGELSESLKQSESGYSLHTSHRKGSD